MKILNIQENDTHVICTFSGKTKFIQKNYPGKKKITVYYERKCIHKEPDSNFGVFFWKEDFKSVPYYEDLNG